MYANVMLMAEIAYAFQVTCANFLNAAFPSALVLLVLSRAHKKAKIKSINSERLECSVLYLFAAFFVALVRDYLRI